MLYFHGFTKTKKGIITRTSKARATVKIVEKEMGGTIVETKQLVGDDGLEVKYGFTPVNPEHAAKMKVEDGDELPLEITDKPVVDKETGEVRPNLFWAI